MGETAGEGESKTGEGSREGAKGGKAWLMESFPAEFIVAGVL